MTEIPGHANAVRDSSDARGGIMPPGQAVPRGSDAQRLGTIVVRCHVSRRRGPCIHEQVLVAPAEMAALEAGPDRGVHAKPSTLPVAATSCPRLSVRVHQM